MTLLIRFLSLASLLPTIAWSQGSLDTTFTPQLQYSAEAIGIQPDGKIITGYERRDNSLVSEMFRFNPDGTPDTTFTVSGNALLSDDNGYISEVKSVSCFMDGTVAISGCFDVVSNSYYAPKIVKLTEAGKVTPYRSPYALNVGWLVRPFIVPLPDNTALMYSEFNMLDGSSRAGIAKLNTNGSWQQGFTPVPSFVGAATYPELAHEVYCAVQQPDGKILLCGEFNRMNGQNVPFLARVTATGALDASFVPAPNNRCYAISVLPDNKILVVGQFTSIGGGSRYLIARLNADGTLDESFDCDIQGGLVYHMIPRSDGKVMIGGSFTSVNGSGRGRYALINSDGSTNAAYSGLGASGYVDGMAIQNDGKVILVGGFSFIGGTVRSFIGRVNPDVAATNTLSIDAEGQVLDWDRGGSAPEIENAEFRLSTNGGVSYTTLLGKGVRTATGWRLQNIQLPGNKTFHIRARGLSRGGLFNNSASVMQSVQSFFRPLPAITSQPVGNTVVVGDAGVGFSVIATSAAAMNFQWKLNGKAIPGATSATYTIPGGVTTAHAGSYTCTITSTAGAVTTAAATLVVITPITITKEPVFQAVLMGKPATFSVTVTGTSPQYQWYKGSSMIPGAISATYKIPAAGLGDETNYHVVVSNFAGPQTSATVQLFIVDQGSDITVPPASAILPLGLASHTLTATVVSESPPLNQWLKNNVAIKGATTTSLTLNALKMTDAGKYAFRSTNPAGSETSAIAEIAIVDQLSTKHFVVKQGGAATLTALAAGNGPSYKWKKAGNYLTETPPTITGTLTKTLKLTGLTPADTAAYTCEVTTPGGSLDSASQQVTVTTGAPEILNTFDLPQAMVGADYDYQVPVNSDPLLTPNLFTMKGHPVGLKIDPFTGRITGRPTVAKTVLTTYNVTVKVSNGSGPGNELTDTLEVLPVPGGLVGNYIGILPADAGIPIFKNGGRVDLSVTSAGSYSGKVILGTLTYPFSGGRLNEGVGIHNQNTILVPRKGLTPLTFQFDLDAVSNLLTGSIFEGVNTAPVSGWRNKWSTTDKALLYKGYYTQAMAVPVPPPNDFTYPHGDSYATFTVADLGTLTVSGRLADDTAFTTSGGFVGPTGQIAVYTALYGTTGGAVWGISTITPAGAAPGYAESTTAGMLNWIKHPQTTGYTYAAGFGPLALTASGAKYAISSAGTNVIGSDITLPDTSITFTGANVETELQNPNVFATLTSTNAFQIPTFASGNNPTSTALKLNTAATGVLNGSFVITEDIDPGPVVKNVKRTAKVYGVVVRNIATGAGIGVGYFTLVQSPGSTTSQVLGGLFQVTNAP